MSDLTDEAVEALRQEQTSSPNPYDDCVHFDDHAVNRFAVAMKGKLAAKRLQGRGGWQEPDVENGYLSRLLREHVDKGDPVDVANLAMMIHQRGERIGPENEGATCGAIERAEAERDDALARLAAAEAQVAALTEERDEAVDLAEERLRGQHRLSNQLNDTARELNARIAALQEALEFYANKEAWSQPPVRTREGLLSIEYENQASKVQGDRGKIARAALNMEAANG